MSAKTMPIQVNDGYTGPGIYIIPVPVETYARLTKIAAEQGLSFMGLINEAITKYLIEKGVSHGTK